MSDLETIKALAARKSHTVGNVSFHNNGDGTFSVKIGEMVFKPVNVSFNLEALTRDTLNEILKQAEEYEVKNIKTLVTPKKRKMPPKGSARFLQQKLLKEGKDPKVKPPGSGKKPGNS